MEITIEMLEKMNACNTHKKRFLELFPFGEADITYENIRLALDAGLDLWWLLTKLPLYLNKQSECQSILNIYRLWYSSIMALHTENLSAINLYIDSETALESTQSYILRAEQIQLARLFYEAFEDIMNVAYSDATDTPLSLKYMSQYILDASNSYWEFIYNNSLIRVDKNMNVSIMPRNLDTGLDVTLDEQHCCISVPGCKTVQDLKNLAFQLNG